MEYLIDRLKTAQRGAQKAGMPIPARLDGKSRLFQNIPTIRVFNLDLVHAGIARKDDQGRIIKQDAAGRTIDLHSLRHTFCTRIARAGVSLQVAQRMMRHSDPSLTMRHYTHLDLGDKISALEKLPSISKESCKAVQAAIQGEKNVP